MERRNKRTIIHLAGQGLSEAHIADLLGEPEEYVFGVTKEFQNLISVPSLKKTEKTRLFELLAEGYGFNEIAEMLNTNEVSIQKIIDKDKTKIKKDARSMKCLELYKNGASLEEIGKMFGITRERVRQITKKEFGYELGFGPMEQRAREKEIDVAYRSIVHGSRGERRGESTKEKIERAIAKGLDPKYFDSLAIFASTAGVSLNALKEYRPDLFNIVNRNARQKSQRWSWYYDACRACGTTTTKHKIYGYCANCYYKSPEFKAVQQRSYEKTRDNRLAHNKQYSEDYFSRPEIKEKLEREYDEKYFGGNRKLALERDSYRCTGCGKPVGEKDKIGRTKVRVWHLGDKEDNSLENLGTYCQGCLFKHKGIYPGNNFGRSL